MVNAAVYCCALFEEQRLTWQALFRRFLRDISIYWSSYITHQYHNDQKSTQRQTRGKLRRKLLNDVRTLYCHYSFWHNDLLPISLMVGVKQKHSMEMSYVFQSFIVLSPLRQEQETRGYMIWGVIIFNNNNIKLGAVILKI